MTQPPFKLPAHREWIVDGLPCATVINPHLGNMNGYVQLPETHPDLLGSRHYELTTPSVPFLFPDGSLGINHPSGYDFFNEIRVHGGWTYGPDYMNWIGFDTAQYGDIWPEEIRLANARPEARRAINIIIELERRYPPGYSIIWSEEKLEREVERVARELAVRAREIIEAHHA